jgi:hypothetical protein
MTLDFTPIDLARKKDYIDRLALCEQVASDYSFINIWGWADEYGLAWAWDEELVWIRQSLPYEAYWAPVGDWSAVDWPGRLAPLSGSGLEFIRVPETLAGMWATSMDGRVSPEEQRGQWDYLYRREDLVALRGNRLHKKKNLVNQFVKKYDFDYQPFGVKQIEHAMAMQEDWCTWRDCESSDVLAAENRAILRVLDHWSELSPILGGALFVDQIIVAYTLAEPLGEDTLLIHFEKGCPDYKGVYQAINQMFLEHAADAYAWVNREQDLDNEGLRKAKLSYQPADFLKKSKIRFTG